MAEGEGELISTGAFRVDREKALEKLSRYQTPDPSLFMLPWVRAAVAGGATHIGMSLAKDGNFIMAFDGEPVRPDLADPSACLFADAPDPRLKQLAVGILAALRLNPHEVTLTSGRAGERRCLKLGGSDETLEAVESENENTILWVLFLQDRLAEDWNRKVFEACRASPVPMRIGDSDLAPFDGKDAVGLMIREGGRRVWLEPAEPESASIQVFQHGVYVCDWKWPGGPLLPADGFIDDPALELNASQTGVVADHRRKAAEAALLQAAGPLVAAVAGTQRERLLRLRGRLSERAWRKAWRIWVAGHNAYGWPEPWAKDKEDLEESAIATRWLKRVAEGAMSERLPPDARRTLSEAPLDVDDHGEPRVG